MLRVCGKAVKFLFSSLGMFCEKISTTTFSSGDFVFFDVYKNCVLHIKQLCFSHTNPQTLVGFTPLYIDALYTVSTVPIITKTKFERI